MPDGQRHSLNHFLPSLAKKALRRDYLLFATSAGTLAGAGGVTFGAPANARRGATTKITKAKRRTRYATRKDSLAMRDTASRMFVHMLFSVGRQAVTVPESTGHRLESFGVREHGGHQCVGVVA